MSQNIVFKGKLFDGIFQRIKNDTNIDDIVENKYVSIKVNSKRSDSSPASAIIGIGNSQYTKYWCSAKDDLTPVIISFRYQYCYAIILKGISFRLNPADLFRNYKIETSMDEMIWDSTNSFDSTIYNITEYTNSRWWDNYVSLDNLKPARFIRITPSDAYGSNLNREINFVIYGMELFGEIIKSYNYFCTHGYNKLYYFIHLTLIVLFF